MLHSKHLNKLKRKIPALGNLISDKIPELYQFLPKGWFRQRFLEKNKRPLAVWQFFFIDKPARLIIRLLFGFAFDLTNSTNLQLLGGQCCLVFGLPPFCCYNPPMSDWKLVHIYNRIASKNLRVSLINFSHSWLQRLRSPLLRLIR